MPVASQGHVQEMLELAADKSTKHSNLIAWYERIGQREIVQRGLLIRLWGWISCISKN